MVYVGPSGSVRLVSCAIYFANFLGLDLYDLFCNKHEDVCVNAWNTRGFHTHPACVPPLEKKTLFDLISIDCLLLVILDINLPRQGQGLAQPGATCVCQKSQQLFKFPLKSCAHRRHGLYPVKSLLCCLYFHWKFQSKASKRICLQRALFAVSVLQLLEHHACISQNVCACLEGLKNENMLQVYDLSGKYLHSNFESKSSSKH